VQSKEDALVDPGKGDSDFGARFGTCAIDAEDTKVHLITRLQQPSSTISRPCPDRVIARRRVWPHQ
jgi:hypothetical protein